MTLDRYEVKISNSFATFDFISEGHLGKIGKSIKYDEMQKGIYNLGFGDKHPLTGQIDDTVVTNNGDMSKILATVAYSIYVFTEKNTNAWIYVTGSSESRIRLYRMAINKFQKEINKDFVIYISLEDGEWYPFESNTKTKEFLIKKKI
jgi:hypothetical protein